MDMMMADLESCIPSLFLFALALHGYSRSQGRVWGFYLFIVFCLMVDPRMKWMMIAMAETTRWKQASHWQLYSLAERNMPASYLY